MLYWIILLDLISLCWLNDMTIIRDIQFENGVLLVKELGINFLSHIREDLRLKVKVAKLGEYRTERGVECTGNTIYIIAGKIAGSVW